MPDVRRKELIILLGGAIAGRPFHLGRSDLMRRHPYRSLTLAVRKL